MSHAVDDLLVELLVEELPPKSLKSLGESFATGLVQGLAAQGLVAADAPFTPYATPRRLALWLPGVAAQAAERTLRHKLMPVSVGLAADGSPTPALRKKLASLGVEGDALPPLQREGEGKSESLVLEQRQRGATLAEGLQQALAQTLSRLPIPKVMSYQLADGWSNVQFVRPAHGLVALHGETVVPVMALGLQAGRRTSGHRFEAARAELEIDHAAHYARVLQDEGAVIPGYAERRAEVARQLAEAASREGLRAIDDEALLDEVTSLVERPNVLTCAFDPAFLAVPPECLILTMKANQKYFPLLDATGALTHQFLVVSNIRPAYPSAVIEGNQRVVRPRLADAKFFFDQDRKHSLESRVPGLDRVVYHGKLGSQGERMQRVRTLARAIGEQLGGPALAGQAERAALLAKADLLSDMVGEFPELQGVMGGYYARHDGEPEAVALAIEDHYKPRYAGDALPRGDAGLVLALADKLETLAGLFAIGQQPSGDKDPFALRRHALGVMRMLVERALPLSLPDLVAQALALFPGDQAATAEALRSFLFERLTGLLRDRGHGAREVDAVLALRPPWPQLLPRLDAVRAFAALPEAEALAAANKRVGNILKKSDAPSGAVDTAALVEPAERALAEALAQVAPEAAAAFDRADYAGSLKALAALRAPVDAFFEGVMVNADDPALRANRLALLQQLHLAMNRVADLARLAA